MHVGRKRKLPETREDKNPGHRFSWIFLLYFWLHHHKERRWVVLHAPEGVCVCVCVCVRGREVLTSVREGARLDRGTVS